MGNEMRYNDQLVGEIELAPGAPMWQVQLAAAASGIARAEFLSGLEAIAEQVRQDGRKHAVELARSIVAQSGLTAQDVFPGVGSKGGSRGPAAAKYRDLATGKTWSGRGKAPKWLDGKDRAQYLV